MPASETDAIEEERTFIAGGPLFGDCLGGEAERRVVHLADHRRRRRPEPPDVSADDAL